MGNSSFSSPDFSSADRPESRANQQKEFNFLTAEIDWSSLPALERIELIQEPGTVTERVTCTLESPGHGVNSFLGLHAHAMLWEKVEIASVVGTCVTLRTKAGQQPFWHHDPVRLQFFNQAVQVAEGIRRDLGERQLSFALPILIWNSEHQLLACRQADSTKVAHLSFEQLEPCTSVPVRSLAHI
ncbi:hypothetical protein [Rothia nasisuis]|uniref:hypothetical protein n=1 Tax=Rothia nasisuis TaxID=2109647 RepID=UPI001F44B9C0|nr:hypothetical protein [Rothia nasisuis]